MSVFLRVFFITRSVTVNRISRLVTSCIGFLDEIVTCIITCHTVIIGIEFERTVDRAKITVGEGGFGECISKLVLRLVESRSGVACLCYSIIRCTGAFHNEIRSGEVGLQTVASELNVI